jgi:hypothetical protein
VVSEHPHLELEIFELANRFCPSVTEPFIQDELCPACRRGDRATGRKSQTLPDARRTLAQRSTGLAGPAVDIPDDIAARLGS